MTRHSFFRRTSLAGAALLVPMLSGCNMVVLHPAGDIAQRQGNLVLMSTALMLLIIVPVMALTILFAWRYRAANKEATYDPDWHHSTQLELVIWAAPLLIIICLGALTWVGTHLLDPYRPLAQQKDANTKPLDIEVVALDWKWLFIYPEQGVATVNELALPVDRPVRFRISASSVMNSFYVPALAGQIYAMPGMETTLHAVLNKPGRYEGFSANYSGAGFSHMRFAVKGLDARGFDGWIAQVRKGGTLDRPAYLKLAQPSEKAPVQHFASVAPGLFDAVVGLCVEPGRMCMADMMAIDAKGGMPAGGPHAVRANDAAGHGKMVAGAYCRQPAIRQLAAEHAASDAPLRGAGLARPDISGTEVAAADAAHPAP